MHPSPFTLYSYFLVFILTSNCKFLGGFGYFQSNIKYSGAIKNSRYSKKAAANQFLITGKFDFFQLYSSKDEDQNDFYAAVTQKNAIHRKKEDANSCSSAFTVQRLLNLYLKYFQSSKNSVEISKFNFNEKNLRKFRVEIISEMIRSGVGPMNETIYSSPSSASDQLQQLPVGYASAKDFFSHLLQFLQTATPTTTFSIVKSILKKEGIRFNSDNGGVSFDFYEEDFEGNGRAIITLKRRIERALSETLLFITEFKAAELQSNDGYEHSEDVTYFSRAIVDRLPAQDRHLHLLLFARMRSTYFVRITGGSRAGGGIGRRAAPDQIRVSEKDLFLQTLRSGPYYITKPSTAARLLFPFATASLRAYHAYRSHYQPSIGRGCEEVDVFPLLSFCIDFDRRAAAQRSHTGCGEDMLVSIRRLLIDRTAFAVISTAGSTQEPLKGRRRPTVEDDCIRLNTVAMELLSFQTVGTDLFRVLMEVGRYCSLMVRVVVRAQEEQDLDVECDNRMVTLKKLLVLLSSMKYLSSAHKLVRSIDIPLGLQSLRSADTQEILSSSVSPWESDSASDEDFFSSDKKKGSVTRSRKVATSSPVDDGDDELFWEKKNIRSLRTGKPDLLGARVDASYSSEVEDRVLDTVGDHLTYLFAEVLQVEKSALESTRARDEMDYVLSTWRRPQLLLDYYYMHDTSADTQNLFRRFLRALFAVSQESVEDIRFNDPLNRLHLDKFDPAVVAAWRDGRTAEGELLPGFNDPQTLFMMGEDSNTCLSIRAKQKATNRGLLSLLLNGGCRVLGEKVRPFGNILHRFPYLRTACDQDASGKLLSRAVVRLLLDGRSGRPVLLVGRPYGGSGSIDDEKCIEIFDQAGALGRLLRLPVLYSTPPPESFYCMSFAEAAAESEPNAGGAWPLLDYSQLVDYVWVGGGQFARLIRRSEQLREAVDGLPDSVALGWRKLGVLEAMPIVDDYQDDVRFAPVFWSTTQLRGRFRVTPSPEGSDSSSSDRSPPLKEPIRESTVGSDQLPDADDEFFSYTIPTRSSEKKRRVTGRKPNRGENGVAVEESPATKKPAAIRAPSSMSVQERQFLRQQLLSQSFQQQKQQRVPLGAVLQRRNGDSDLSEPTSPQQREENDAEDDDMFFG